MWEANARADLMGIRGGQFQEVAFEADMYKLCGNAHRMQRPITFSKDDPRRLGDVLHWYQPLTSNHKGILWTKEHTSSNGLAPLIPVQD